MIRKETYKVAGHLFSLESDCSFPFWDKVQECYGPFRVADDVPVLFSLKISEFAIPEDKTLVYSNVGKVELGFVALNVYRCAEGHYYEFQQPGSDRMNGRLLVREDLTEALALLEGTPMQEWMTFTTVANFSYLMCTSQTDTLMAHSSAVIKDGKAYMFLGKSGTGKSTHSRMWLSVFPDAVLMNDDHPVIRVHEDGTVMAYGSPWSGKTHCYKNISAPVGAVVRISRAMENRAQRLTPIEAYGSLMTSCSGMTWERRFADAKDSALQKVIAAVPCWTMHCLPDENAAEVCHGAVTGK